MTKDSISQLAGYLILLLLLIRPFAMQGQTNDEKTQSPYFIVLSEEEGAAFPLKSTNVNVDISGVIADVNVKQSYANNGTLPIEAVYVFPGSTNAAVYAMKMNIGGEAPILKYN